MLEVLFWASLALIVYTHAGYPLLLWLLARLRRTRADRRHAPAEPPAVSLIVAAHDEADVIAAKIENALALDYPRDRLELIVASDGSADGTVEAARTAGADRVLELPRGGKIRAQDAGVEAASGEIVAFTDANCRLAPDALRRLRRRSPIPRWATSAGMCASRATTGPTRRVPTGATSLRCARSSRASAG